jgi:hypothetical protein
MCVYYFFFYNIILIFEFVVDLSCYLSVDFYVLLSYAFTKNFDLVNNVRENVLPPHIKMTHSRLLIYFLIYKNQKVTLKTILFFMLKSSTQTRIIFMIDLINFDVHIYLSICQIRLKSPLCLLILVCCLQKGAD